MLISLVCFCLISSAIGVVINGFLKERGQLERILMSLAFGVCSFPIVGVIFSSFNGLSLLLLSVLSFCVLAMYFKPSDLKIPSVSRSESLVILMAISLFAVFYMGGFSVPWLEDGDPNGHAAAASYIAHYHTYSKPADMFVARYMEPYPVGFQMWMGVLAQDGYDIVSTLRIYNYIFISLGLIVFFYFMRAISNDDNLSVCSTFILLALPTFSTRFIFSQALAITQVIMIMYLIALAMKGNRSRFKYGGIVLGSLFITQTTSSAIMGGFLIIWLLFDSVINRKLNMGILVSVIAIGTVIGGTWWTYEFNKYGFDKVKTQMGLDIMSKGIIGFSDPVKEFYTIGDFINSNEANKIDNMRGVGAAAFILMLYGVLKSFAVRKEYQILMVLWLIFGILGVYSNYLPVSLIPSRFWAYMSIPFAAVAGYGLVGLVRKDLGIIGFVAIVGLLATSAYPKYVVNGQAWESARLFTKGDHAVQAYMAANSTVGAKAFDACMYERVWSMNLWDDPLDKEAIIFKNVLVNVSAYGWDSEGWLKLNHNGGSRVFDSPIAEVYDFLKAKGYKYLLVNTKCIGNGINNVAYEDRIGEFDKSSEFGVFFKYDMERVYEIR